MSKKATPNISDECLQQIAANVSRALEVYYSDSSIIGHRERATPGITQPITEITLQITPACQADIAKGNAASSR